MQLVIVLGIALDVDPQQLFAAKRADGIAVEVDPAVVAGRIEQAGGDATQWMFASKSAAAAAIRAVTYCSAIIARSAELSSSRVAVRASA
ncbi:MAG TPA: hypothetical protein VFI69_11510 [Candidatus Limnocylindrales bacterium]|nr:hypothetical protein [Candidatus Limnocylindrales bacterium]